MSDLDRPPASPPRKPGATDEEDVSEKYRNLKRRYEEIEEEASAEPQESGERHVRLREERESLLERIQELEKHHNLASRAPESASKATGSTSAGNSGDAYAQDGDSSQRRVRRRIDQEDAAENGTGKDPSSMSPPPNGDANMDVSPNSPTHSPGSSAAPGASTSTPTARTSPTPPHDVPMSDASALSDPVPAKSNAPASEGQPRTSNNDTRPASPPAAPQEALNGITSQPHPEAGPNVSQTSDGPEAPAPAPPPLSINTDGQATSKPPTPTSQSEETPLAARPGPSAAQDTASHKPSSDVNPTPDANVDPNLDSQPSSNPQPSQTENPSQPATTAPRPTSNGPAASFPTPLSGNPYLNLFLPKANPNGTPTPTSAHPLAFHPYMFYSPITPITPNSPPPYGYPYMYGPMIPAYPPPPPPPHHAPAAAGPSTVSSTSTPAQSRPPPPPPPPQAEPAAPPPAPKKRAKAHVVTSKSFSIPLVPRDKNGKPMLPLNVGIMTVISLGTVCMRDHFHTERYIFPVGYEVTRRYLSTVDPTAEVVYHCTILDGGDGPKFQIVPSDTPDKPVIAGTATGAWSSIVKTANAIRSRQHSNSVSGPDFFGLGQNTIKHLIQELPNADKLKTYVWQHFIEGGPLGGRHASVIPALPEEYDASVPRGPVYHTPLEREKLKAIDGSASPGELPKGISHYPQHIIAQAIPHGETPSQGPSAAPQVPSHYPDPESRPTPASPRANGARGRRGGGGGSATATPPPVVAERPPASQCLLNPVTGPPVIQGAPTYFPSATILGQAPTPVTPNTPAPSIAMIMNGFRPNQSTT